MTGAEGVASLEVAMRCLQGGAECSECAAQAAPRCRLNTLHSGPSMNQHARIDAPIPFIDVAAQRRRLGARIDDAVRAGVGSLPVHQRAEVASLSAILSAFCGARHAIGVASGTDALVLVLMAKGIGRGDAVICPSFTYAARPEAVALVGATPVFGEVDETTFNIDPAGIERAVAAAKRAGLKPKALMTVDLFGLPADYEAINAVAERLGLYVIDDAAQAFGATPRAARSARSRRSPRPASFPRSRSAATATAARCSPTTTNSPT